jgi:hypothetical protein
MFDELVLDGHNYPTWALDVKISLAFRGIIAALTPPAEREAVFLNTYKDELALDVHNYPTWALDVKISLAFRGIMTALTPPAEREAAFLNTYKYQALYIIRNHLHPDLKLKYVMEEEPHNLWVALKDCYEQQKAILLLEANHEWTQIHLQDFKSIEDYNHAIHKVYAKLRFCEKEP